jgi:hypothetical protein
LRTVASGDHALHVSILQPGGSNHSMQSYRRRTSICSDSDVLLAGDVSEDIRTLQQTLMCLRDTFEKVFFIPGAVHGQSEAATGQAVN